MTFIPTVPPGKATGETAEVYKHMTQVSGDGYDDIPILDLAIAVAEANQWARIHRLLGLGPELFYVG